MPRIDLIQEPDYRAGTAAAWYGVNPTLDDREIGLETDTGRRKRGDGTTPWNDQPYEPPITLCGSGAPSAPVGGVGDYYVDVATQLLYGPKGTGGVWGSSVALLGDKYYAHDQTGTPSADVTVTHNLGKHPAVTVEDTAGNTLVAQITHLSNTQARIQLNGATTFTATFN